MAPLNPARYSDAVGFRFRVGRYGYGAAPEMTRRCFERLDTEGIGTCDDPPRPGRYEAGHDPGAGLLTAGPSDGRGDPVSWLLIEPGWDVVARRDGDRQGRGDRRRHRQGHLQRPLDRDRLARQAKVRPFERVRAITEGRVEFDLSAEDAEGLDEHDPQPPSEQFLRGLVEVTHSARPARLGVARHYDCGGEEVGCALSGDPEAEAPQAQHRDPGAGGPGTRNTKAQRQPTSSSRNGSSQIVGTVSANPTAIWN